MAARAFSTMSFGVECSFCTISCTLAPGRGRSGSRQQEDYDASTAPARLGASIWPRDTEAGGGLRAARGEAAAGLTGVKDSEPGTIGLALRGLSRLSKL
jgi:hypothetical protein